MSWEYVTLDKLGSVSRGRSKHRPRNDKALFGGKYPFVQTADVKAAELYLTEYSETYNERGLEQSKLWKAGTLCITIAANIADTAILGIDACFPDSVMGFVPYDGVSNVKFVKYAFDILQRDFQKISQGTAQDNLSWQKLSTIKFPAPPIEIQNKIVNILSVYDDLIENNRKQIKLLEEAAQRLYKEWFVDLRFPGYENTPIIDGVPEGWKKEHIGNVFTTVLGGTPSRSNSNYWNGDIPWINSGEVNNLRIMGPSEYITKLGLEKSSTKLMPKHTTVLAITGATLGQVSYTEIETCANQSVVGIYDDNDVYSIYIYFYVTNNIKAMIGKATGGAQQHINKDIVNAYEIVLPNEKVISQLNEVIRHYFDKIANLYMQNSKLVEARDRLLPKLMNGEIEV